MNVDEFTLRLDSLLDPYLGKVNYGNLRKGNNWPPSIFLGKYLYSLVYKINFGSASQLDISLNENNTLSLRYFDHEYSIESGLFRFINLIKSIPEKRIKSTIRMVKDLEKFEERLKGDSMMFSSSIELYTPEELKLIRDHFSIK
ncbi:MAG: hypothetical protein PHF86_12375 [Candidatus Nanoarchaeia archaeon]|nr:hypothetical protein [Candidatus Nanoarchaeia archaeon]